MNTGFVVLALLILGGIFWFDQVYISAQEKAQLYAADSLCRSTIGNIGQILFPSFAQDCQTVRNYVAILSFAPILYLIGFVFLLAGAAVGSSKPVAQPQPVYQPYQQPPPQPSVPPAQQPTTQTMGNFCTKCGSQMQPDAKFCHRCGTPSSRLGTINL